MFKHGNVTVMVSDLERAVKFYVETLGLKLQYEAPGQWAQVEAPGLTIGLHPAGEDTPQPGKSDSLSIGFEVEDIAAAAETLEARGIVFAPIVDEKATKLAFFNDPDGNPLYLAEVK